MVFRSVSYHWWCLKLPKTEEEILLRLVIEILRRWFSITIFLYLPLRQVCISVKIRMFIYSNCVVGYCDPFTSLLYR